MNAPKAQQTLAAIEFWFDFGSNYSYLSAMRIEPEAWLRGIRILWKPFLLGAIFRDLGFDTSPFVLQKEKGTYVWQDVAAMPQIWVAMDAADDVSAPRRSRFAHCALRPGGGLDRRILPPCHGTQFYS